MACFENTSWNLSTRFCSCWYSNEDKPEIETFLTSDDDHNLQHNDTNVRDDDKSKQEIDALLKSDSNHNIPNENEADITSSAVCLIPLAPLIFFVNSNHVFMFNINVLFIKEN